MEFPDITAYRPQIEAALQYSGGSHTFEDIAAGVEEGDYQFWPTPNSVVITQIVEYPQYTALHFFLAGGRLDELEPLAPIILDWGAQQGCTKASLIGRKGWDRSFLARTGWTKSDVILMEKTL